MLKEGEVKVAGDFLGLYETVGHLVVRASSEEVFLITATTRKGQKSCIRTIEGEFWMLSVETYLIGTGLQLRVVTSRVNFLVHIFSCLRLLIGVKRLINTLKTSASVPQTLGKNSSMFGQIIHPLIHQGLISLVWKKTNKWSGRKMLEAYQWRFQFKLCA